MIRQQVPRNAGVPSGARKLQLHRRGLSCRQQKRASNLAGPADISFCRTYFVQVSLIIFTLVTLKLPIASLLDAFSTCPSFFSSAFVSGLAVPVTVT